MGVYGILEGKKVVPCDVTMWAPWFEATPNRRVAETKIGDSLISTVFLGIDHGFGGDPLWFETMVFGGPFDQEQHRYQTYEESEYGHKMMIKKIEENSLDQTTEGNK
jgi:hypothetical protein